MRISDWSSDVCSSDLEQRIRRRQQLHEIAGAAFGARVRVVLQGIGVGAGVLRDRRHAEARLGQDEGAVAAAGAGEIGRATWRARVCQYGEISGVAAAVKKKSRYKPANKPNREH